MPQRQGKRHTDSRKLEQIYIKGSENKKIKAEKHKRGMEVSRLPVPAEKILEGGRWDAHYNLWRWWWHEVPVIEEVKG